MNHQVSDGGLQHSLTITDVTVEDGGQISVHIDDDVNGMKRVACKLVVKGCM